jgi:hypothetical protein
MENDFYNFSTTDRELLNCLLQNQNKEINFKILMVIILFSNYPTYLLQSLVSLSNEDSNPSVLVSPDRKFASYTDSNTYPNKIVVELLHRENPHSLQRVVHVYTNHKF